VPTSSTVCEEFRQRLIADGVIRSPTAVFTALAGGVSSDIYRVDDGDRVFVVKRALPRLRVSDPWYADVSRNGFEVAYLRRVARLLPEIAPKVLTASSEQGYFTMEFLGSGYRSWKELLLAGHCDRTQAQKVGATLGAIHCATWDDDATRADFESTRNFHQLRLDPYLLTTAERHPELRAQLRAEAARIRCRRRCLVHGDYSPKNLLFRANRLVILDCEVAWYGDPGFDVAFLLTHLMIKALHIEAYRDAFLSLVGVTWESYREALGGERADEVERCLPGLLTMLMLARVDGKSPLEYLVSEGAKERVREFARCTLPHCPAELAGLTASWREFLERAKGP